MKKIGIVTINDNINYGNRLQNYAVQEVLISIGCNVETIVNRTCTKSSFVQKINKARRQPLSKTIANVKEIIRQKYFLSNYEKYIKSMNREKSVIFRNFNSKYIKESSYKINPEFIPKKMINEYDYFIVGSDQVWNPNFRGNLFIDFLTFAPKNKRISYAASFGISKLPKEYIKDYQFCIAHMANVSVREDDGAKIVKELTGRDVPVLVDPTLMLSREKWLSISKIDLNKPEKPYILTYFLGDLSGEIKKRVNEIAKKKKLVIVNLEKVKFKKHYTTGPAEFIDYINSSEIFLTDSFHGVIFSILFEKPFIIFDRICKTPPMNSRLDTLLSKLKFEHRKWKNMKSKDNIFLIDYSHVPPILMTERKKAIDYLKNALDINDTE